MSSRYAVRLVGRQFTGAFHTQQIARSFATTTRPLDEKTTNSADKHLETNQRASSHRASSSSSNDKHDGQADDAMLSDYDMASTAHATELMQLLEKRRALAEEHKQQIERLRDTQEVSMEEIEEELQDAFRISSSVYAYISHNTGRARVTVDDVKRIRGGIEEKAAASHAMVILLGVSLGASFAIWFAFGDWPPGGGFSQVEVAKAKTDAVKAKEEASKARAELAKLQRTICDATTKEEIMRLYTTAEDFERGRWSNWLGTATITSCSAVLLWTLLRKSS